MREKSFLVWILPIFFFLLFLFSIPLSFREKIRGSVISVFSPVWKTFSFSKHLPSSEKEELLRLQMENQLLAKEVDLMREMFLSQTNFLEEAPSLENIFLSDEKLKNYFLSLYQLRLQAIPAKIIYRNPGSWGNFAWIDVGEKDNEQFSFPVIAKNSSVLMGNSLVGLVEYVGKKQSRIRLISDPYLIPSVRVSRGKMQDIALLEKINELLFFIKDEKKYDSLLKELFSLKKSLYQTSPALFLAKGELIGAKDRKKGSSGSILQGTGFSYDFADEMGPARDLRTGKPLNDFSSKETFSLIKKGDLLVTTGFDGIFPPGLFVAKVTQVFPLEEGDFYYSIEAKSTAGHLDLISTVFILPPYKKDHYEIRS